MEEYIEKRIKENLAKNFQRGCKPQLQMNAPTKRGKATAGKPTNKRKSYDGKDQDEGKSNSTKRPSSNPNKNSINKNKNNYRGHHHQR
jgi:hypothetical protein